MMRRKENPQKEIYINGKKKVEHRKTNQKHPIDRAIIYVTAPTNKIIVEASIDFIITDNH